MEMALIYLQQWQNTTTDLVEPPLSPPEPAESDKVMIIIMLMMYRKQIFLYFYRILNKIKVK